MLYIFWVREEIIDESVSYWSCWIYYYHLAQLAEGVQVYGIDNLNDYYDVVLKKDRLALHPKLDLLSSS